MTIKAKYVLIILILVIILYAHVITNSFTFEPFYSLYPDTSELYFLHTITDGTLFRAEPFVVKYHNSLGSCNNEFIFTGIYTILLCFFPLPLAIKILSISLCAVTVFFVYKISLKYLASDLAFFPATMFLIYFLCKDTFYGGTMRNFGILFFVAFIYSLENKKLYALPFLLSVSALFYPYLTFPFFIMCILQIKVFRGLNREKIFYSLLLALNLGLAIFFTVGKGAGPIFHVALSNLDKVGVYKYTQHVHQQIDTNSFYSIFLYFILNLNEHGKLYVYYTLLFLVLSLIIIVVKKSSFIFPKSLLQMCFASLAGFVVIYPIHPLLASRLFSFTVPFLIVCITSFNFIKLVNNKRIAYGVIAIMVLNFLTLHPLFNSIKGYGKYKSLYNFIEKLPKDALIAGNPKSEIIRTTPFFAKRPIFFSEKLFFRSVMYSEEKKIEKLKSLLRALYGLSLPEVREFIAEYKVDYFVIEEDNYTKKFLSDLDASIKPFDIKMRESIRSRVKRGPSFILDFAKNNYLYKENINGRNVYILKADSLNRLAVNL